MKYATVILLLDDRQALERIEGNVYKNISEVIEELNGFEANLDSLGYYDICDFTELVNDQVLDNLTDTFICFIKIEK